MCIAWLAVAAFAHAPLPRDLIWSGSGRQTTNEVRFVYDGMLVLQEHHFDPQLSTNDPQQVVTYTRGLDLSGTRQGAGGIGGLLARSQHSTTNTQHAFYHSDGAGNVTALMDAQQHIVARYLYDPFGRQLGQWGELAAANRYRFSSKEVHPQSGLYYYGFRHYDPTLQRWLTKDPMEEAGGINLYRFVGNSPLNAVDSWGLAYGDWWDPRTYLPGYARLKGMNDLDAFAKNNNYQNYEDMFLSLNEDDPHAHQRLMGENIRAVGDVAQDAANGYLTAATAVTPTAAGARCVSLLMPGGKALRQAGTKATIRELQGGLKEAQALFDQLAQGGKVIPRSTYQGTLVQLPNGGTVGLRTVMTKSPGTAATIDVNIPGIAIDKIKFNP